MTYLIAQLHLGTHALIAAGIWACMTCLVPLSPPQWRMTAFWCAVVCGVPVLGWLTFAMGPGVGVAALALGLLLLVRSPLGRRKPPHEAKGRAQDFPPRPAE